MSPRQLFKIFRLTLLILIIAVIGAVLVGSYYLTQKGLNSEWRGRIAQELESLGIIADFESLTLDPAKGLVAEGVQIYSDSSRENMIAALEHIVLDVDKTKLMRGIVRVNNLSLKEANISLPLDLSNPESEQLIIKDLSGKIFLPNRKTINAKNIIGQLSGINLDIDANVWSDHLSFENKEFTSDEKQSRILQVTDILNEIKKWDWPEGNPPLLKIYMEGNISKSDSLIVNFALDANQLRKNDATLENISLNGDYKNSLLTLKQFTIKDTTGTLAGFGNCHLVRKESHFSVNSNLQLHSLTKKLFGVDLMESLTFSTAPSIQSKGKISFDHENKIHVQLTGQASANDFSFLEAQFTSLKTAFSAKDNDLFLNDLHITHSQGELKGRVLMQNDEIRYEAKSTLPASSYLPFIKNLSLEKALKHASFSSESNIQITAEGTMNRNDLTDWTSKGHAEFSNMSFNETSMKTLSGAYNMNQEGSSFTDIQADFDYSDYQLRKDHGGPTSGMISVESIIVDSQKNNVKINDANGNAWPAPIIKLFAPEVASYIESYRFHSPPNLNASGVFGTSDAAIKDTNFTVNLSSSNTMSYRFLGNDLTLNNLRSKILVRGEKVSVSDLSFQTFTGPCSGSLTINIDSKQHSYSGSLKGKDILFKDICTSYELNNTDQGLLAGNIDFSGDYKKIKTFNAKGKLQLKNGNSFAIPLLAPLTPLVEVVLGKRNPKETAADTSLSYTITNGIFQCDDFFTSTPSLRFTGEANIDFTQMKAKTLVRMNARNVLDIPTNELKPFMGIFQFEGTGSLSAPTWQSTRLTKPLKGKNDIIFKNN